MFLPLTMFLLLVYVVVDDVRAVQSVLSPGTLTRWTTVRLRQLAPTVKKHQTNPSYHI